MKLELENGNSFENPTSDIIAEALRTLSDSNLFAIPSWNEMFYIQTSHNEAGEFVLEYQDGSTANHYVAVKNDLSLEQVMNAFQLYAVNDSRWKVILGMGETGAVRIFLYASGELQIVRWQV